MCALLHIVDGADSTIQRRAFVQLEGSGGNVAMDPGAGENDQSTRDHDVADDLANDDGPGSVDVAFHQTFVVDNQHAVGKAKFNVAFDMSIDLDATLKAQVAFEELTLRNDGLDVFRLNID